MPLPEYVYQNAARGDQDSLRRIKDFEQGEKISGWIIVITICLAFLLFAFVPWDVVFCGSHEKTSPRRVVGEVMTVCSQGLLFNSCREITIYRKGE